MAGTPTEEKSTVPSSEPIYAGIEEVFDIMPLYGTMQPGERQKFAFSFYAHAGISVQGRAVCRVEGGPDYFINLSGGANAISYSVNTEPIDFGNQVNNKLLSLLEFVTSVWYRVKNQFYKLNRLEPR